MRLFLLEMAYGSMCYWPSKTVHWLFWCVLTLFNQMKWAHSTGFKHGNYQGIKRKTKRHQMQKSRKRKPELDKTSKIQRFRGQHKTKGPSRSLRQSSALDLRVHSKVEWSFARSGPNVLRNISKCPPWTPRPLVWWRSPQLLLFSEKSSLFELVVFTTTSWSKFGLQWELSHRLVLKACRFKDKRKKGGAFHRLLFPPELKRARTIDLSFTNSKFKSLKNIVPVVQSELFIPQLEVTCPLKRSLNHPKKVTKNCQGCTIF